MEVSSDLNVLLSENTPVNGPQVAIKNLEQYLEQYDVLFLFNDMLPEMKKLPDTFLKSQALKNTEKKVLVLTVEETIQPPPGQHCRTLRLTKKDYEVFHGLHRMYEFSDRLRVLDPGVSWGSLENYVRMGILTMEELFEALLH